MSELEKDPKSIQDGVISIHDLTEQELEWYNKRVELYHLINVAAPTRMLLNRLVEGRKPQD
jgi:hypothetical protein